MFGSASRSGGELSEWMDGWFDRLIDRLIVSFIRLFLRVCTCFLCGLFSFFLFRLISFTSLYLTVMTGLSIYDVMR